MNADRKTDLSYHVAPCMVQAKGRLRFQSDVATAPVVGTQTGDPSACGRMSWRIAERMGTRWIGFYRTLVIALILLYYSVLTAATVWLLSMLQQVMLGTGDIVPMSASRGAALLALGVILVALATQLWRGLVGLVTPVHDNDDLRGAAVALSRTECPDLYRMVSEVGASVGAPLPDEIHVTDRAECYVSEERRFAIRTQRRLILVLGLPHLAVLDTSELKVILAHELAHFRSGDTTFGVFIYRFLESLRVAHQSGSGRRWIWLTPSYWISKLTFHLFLLMVAPIRQYQELRADSLSAAYCGGDLAARTLLKEWLLAHQFDVAATEFQQMQADHSAGGEANVFRHFTSRWCEFSTAGQQYLERRLTEEERPSILDSHPTTGARLDLMRRFPSQTQQFSPPSRYLLKDFNAVESRLYASCDAVATGA